jgi:hypothetical protein
MTAVGKKRQARRNEKYALLLIAARLIGLNFHASKSAQLKASPTDIAWLSDRISRRKSP